MNISAAKKIRRDICRTMGHQWETYKWVTAGGSHSGDLCSRCKKRVITASRVNIDTWPISSGPSIKYDEISVRRFDILKRAQVRADIDIMGMQPPEEL